MATHSLGSITFVISENHRQSETIGEEEAEQLSNQFAEYFRFLLTKNGLNQLSVTGMQWTTGCVTIVISIGIVAVAGGGFAITKLLKEYKDMREGLSKLLEDLKNAKAWVSRKFRKPKTIPPAEGATSNSEKEPFHIMFEQLANIYQSTEPGQRKFWAAGQKMTVMNEKGDCCKYTIAVKRDDISLPGELPAANSTVKKNSKKKKKKS